MTGRAVANGGMARTGSALSGLRSKAEEGEGGEAKQSRGFVVPAAAVIASRRSDVAILDHGFRP